MNLSSRHILTKKGESSSYSDSSKSLKSPDKIFLFSSELQVTLTFVFNPYFIISVRVCFYS